MSVLKEAYIRRVGDRNVKKQGNGYNGPCPFCGGSSDNRSDRFMVWPDRESTSETCAQHHILGSWFCRQCTRSGDTIAFLMEVEGMTFKSACAELGIITNAKKAPPRRTPQPPKPVEQNYTPREWPIRAEDPVKWREYAEKLHAESRESLHKNPHVLKWLAERGIDALAVDRYQIGYLQGQQGKTGRIKSRGALGLAPGKKKDGSPKNYVFIPRGIVIPHFDAAGRILRLRIRRPSPMWTSSATNTWCSKAPACNPCCLKPEARLS